LVASLGEKGITYQVVPFFIGSNASANSSRVQLST
jgi:hypothetical protein